MTNWDWNGGYSMQRDFVDSGSHSSQGQGSYFNNGYYQSRQQQYYVPYNSQIAPPPPGFDGGNSSTQQNYYGIYNTDQSSYQPYQPPRARGNNQVQQFQDSSYVPTMIYSNSTTSNNNANNEQWYSGDYVGSNVESLHSNTENNTEKEKTSNNGERGWYGREFMPSTSSGSEVRVEKDTQRNMQRGGGNIRNGGGRGSRYSDNRKFYNNGRQNYKPNKMWQQGVPPGANNLLQSTSGFTGNKVKPRENWEAKSQSFTRKKNSDTVYFPHGDVYNQPINSFNGIVNQQQRLNGNERLSQNKLKVHWRNRDDKNGGWRSRKGNENSAICQRERLIEQLCRGTLECLVCCDKIRHHDSVWSCTNCYHVLHLKCTVKWASSSKDDHGWRCPACQNITKTIPTEYTCMCGKLLNPEFVRGETPHCCGHICGRKKDCPHACTILCHPGPCPQCCANIKRSCGCGKTNRTVLCSSTVTIECDSVCEKALNCGVHVCQEKCHQGECKPCERKLHQSCYCGQNERDLDCDGEVLPTEMGGPLHYECGSACPLTLSCGSHQCPKTCHSGSCPECKLDPNILKTCPCGRFNIPKEARSKCTDPVPLCDNICGKVLKCGPAEKHHLCKSKCHEGECPPCNDETSVVCRCGSITKNVSCKELSINPDTLCLRRCSKKRFCGKHKCSQVCCIDVDHICPLRCNKKLNCGHHNCESLCHKGYCQPCLAASFDELHCECGKSVILPPVPCGTKPPECKEPCPRNHPCGHPPLHNCHSYSTCPPCSVLTTKYCFGAHELRKTVPCHMGEYSCGLPCGRQLSCGHKCIKKCHDGSCLPVNVACTQPCTEKRKTGCEHPCNAPCHAGKPCPTNVPCLEKIEVTCECGRRSVSRTCSENSSEYQRIATSLLALKMADVRLGKSVDTTDMSPIVSKMSLKTLDCNEECRLQERNLRLAIGLQIANPDLSSKLHPKYSDSMKAWAKKDSHFCEMVHKKLTELVRLAKTSKQKSRSYSFQSMGSIKRQFIHEYCELFGIESAAYDPEPNRNVVATAHKDKCWLPSYSLIEIVQRESGHRKAPSLLPSLKKDTSLKEKPRLVPVRSKLLQPSVLAKHEPNYEDPL